MKLDSEMQPHTICLDKGVFLAAQLLIYSSFEKHAFSY